MKSLLRSLAFLVLASCAPTVSWVKPGANDAQMRADLAACRRAADREVAPDYDRRIDRDVDRDTGPGGGRGNPLDGAERQQAKRDLDRQTAACMMEQGYAKAKAETKK